MRVALFILLLFLSGCGYHTPLRPQDTPLIEPEPISWVGTWVRPEGGYSYAEVHILRMAPGDTATDCVVRNLLWYEKTWPGFFLIGPAHDCYATFSIDLAPDSTVQGKLLGIFEKSTQQPIADSLVQDLSVSLTGQYSTAMLFDEGEYQDSTGQKFRLLVPHQGIKVQCDFSSSRMWPASVGEQLRKQQ